MTTTTTMTMLDGVWVSVVGVAFLATVSVAILFWREEGRLRLYLSLFLFAVALQAGTAFVSITYLLLTATNRALWASPVFILLRIGWCIVAITSITLVLYQRGVLNGHQRNKKL